MTSIVLAKQLHKSKQVQQAFLPHATQLQRSSAIARVGDNDDAHLV